MDGASLLAKLAKTNWLHANCVCNTDTQPKNPSSFLLYF